MEVPRFQLKITSKVKGKVGKGECILTEHGDPINIVLYDGGNVIANDHPLASASVMMVVLNGEFNKDDIKYNWTKEDFQKSIRRPREGNSATGDVNKIIESTVSGCTFNLAGGSCNHRDAKISENSSNKKVRLGVMVVSQTEERVLEGLSNHFLVRDRPKKSKLALVDRSSTLGNNIEQATGSRTPENSTHGANLQCLQPPSSYNGGGHFLPTTDNMPNTFPYGTNELAPVDGSSTPGNNTEQATGSRTHGANLQCLQPPSSYNGGGHFLPTTDNMPNTFPYGTNGSGYFVAGSEHMSMLPPVQSLSVWPAGGLHSSTISDPRSGPVCGPTGLGGFQHDRTFPVQLLWDRPDVEPSKRWNLLDQLMPLYSRQPKIHNGDFPTSRRGEGSRSPHSLSAGSANALRRSAKMDIATGAMNSLLPKLPKLLLDEYKLQKGVKEEIEELEQELTSMNAALRKVSEVPVNQLDEPTRIWARDMRELSYDIEDAVDTFMVRCKGHKPTNPHWFKALLDRATDLFKMVWTSHEIHGVIKDIMSQVKKASERRKRYKVDSVAAKPATASVDPRLEAKYRKATELVGIEGPKDELVKRLMGGDLSRKQPNIVSIVGFEGLGKTTLANALLQDLKGKFDCHFFVSVSHEPDIKKIFENILIQLGEEKSDFQAWDGWQLIYKIRELLENKRCLCIVDDIWDESAWDIIKLALQDGNQGSKIITTTRKMAVAEHAGGGVYYLKPLCDAHSKMLLNKRIFDSEDGCPPDLTEVTEKILKKCGGVPLAIITTASLLANKPRDLQKWEKVNKSISSGLGNSLTVDKMREILSLSYYDLPSHLKTCLLYLSKYPEDMKIRKDILVWSWIAEGFITDEGQPAGTNLQEVGEGYFNELINRSLIQAADIVSIDEQDGQVHACQVHDMVLELINKLSAEEGFVTVLLSDGQQAGTSAVQKKIRRLSLHAERTTFASTEARERLSYPHVRSLAAFGRVDSMPPLSGFPVLRVLQLEDCSRLQNNHLKDIGEFHHLRFLRLSRAFSITELPESIGNLQFLETLDIRGTFRSVLQLPKSFVNLVNLERLIADVVRLPHGVTLGNMECLQQLVGILFDEETMQAIGDLTELRVLKIMLKDEEEGGFMTTPLTEPHHCKNLQDLTIETQMLYSSLDLMKVVPSRLQRFKTNGLFRELPGWINSSLSCLTTLSIRLSSMTQEHLMVLAELPSLRFLRIIITLRSSERLIIHRGASAFPYLQDLHFYCNAMRFKFTPGAMPKLRRLWFQIHVYVWGENDSFGLENLPSLRHVFVDFGGSNVGWKKAIQGAEDDIRKEINDNPNHPSLDFGSVYDFVSED